MTLATVLAAAANDLAQSEPPAIAQPPTSQATYLDSSATFRVSATGTAPLTYQWQFNGTALVGGTASSLSLARLTFAQAGPYSVVVGNGAGSTTSQTAWLSVLPTNVVSLGTRELQFGRVSRPVWEATREDDLSPQVTGDGLALYYASTAPGGVGGLDIWMVTRPALSSPWGTPVNLGPTVNSGADEATPRLSPDGLSLYFSSARSGGKGDWDIWVATRASSDAAFSTPVNLGSAVNSSTEDGIPQVSADDRTLVFSSRRSGGLGAYDIWMSSRANALAAWEPARHLPAPINSSSGGTLPTALSRDGLLLVFKSWRSIPWSSGIDALYVCERTSAEQPFGPPVLIRRILDIGPGGSDYCSLSDDGATLYVGTYRELYPNWPQLVQIGIGALPQLRGHLTEAGFGLELQGREGATYELRVSSDLVTWTPWLTTNTTGAIVVTDPVSAGDGRRFYSVLSH